MKFTKTGQRYSAIHDSVTYLIRKSPVFTSQWEASRKAHGPGSPWVLAATTFDTLRDAKAWCADDYAALTN